MTFRYKFASFIASVARFVLTKILRRKAGFFPGKVALKIYPDILKECDKKFDGALVFVTGTNGKTSVTALISKILQNEGAQVITNSTGANMESGIVSACLAFKDSRRPKRRKRFDGSDNINPDDKVCGVFEIDELWVEKVMPKMHVDYLVLLNLFPDQADRFGSITNIQKSLHSALEKSPHTKFYYNADDPNSQIVADYVENETFAFGCNEKISEGDIDGLPNTSCPKCETMLTYLTDQYAQLGNYRCPNCGFARNSLDFSASDIKLNDKGFTWQVGRNSYSTANSAEYFVYNLTAVIGMCDLLGCSDKNIVGTIAMQKNDNGRMEDFEINGKSVTINLAKNPAGFNQNLKYIWNHEKTGDYTVAFFVNKKEGDGKSANWLNDVAFNSLKKTNPQIFVGGEAIHELNDCMRDADLVSHRVEKGNDVLESSSFDKVYIIANYTAMFPILEELENMEKHSK